MHIVKSSGAAAHVRHRAWVAWFSRVHWASEASTEREGLAALMRQNGVKFHLQAQRRGLPLLARQVWVVHFVLRKLQHLRSGLHYMRSTGNRLSERSWHCHGLAATRCCLTTPTHGRPRALVPGIWLMWRLGRIRI